MFIRAEKITEALKLAKQLALARAERNASGFMHARATIEMVDFARKVAMLGKT